MESRLEKIFPGYECLTFSSLAGFVTTALDEFESIEIYLKSLDTKYLNAFLNCTSRKTIKNWNDDIQTIVEETTMNVESDLRRFVQCALFLNNELEGLVLDFADDSELLESAPVFVTRNAEYAEKLDGLVVRMVEEKKFLSK